MSAEADLDEYSLVVCRCVDAFLGLASDVPPPTLYHFTDAAGLVGILDKQTVWFSLATSLNDVSELEYGLSVVEEAFGTCSDGMSDGLRRALLSHLRHPRAVGGLALNSIPFVASLCGRIDKSVHWLHYGQSGKGMAVGFDARRIVAPPMRLVRVVYDRSRQIAMARQLLGGIQELSKSIVREETPAAALDDIVAVAFSGFMHMLAAHFKDASFEEEEEWRLVVYALGCDGRPATEEEKALLPPVRFRAINGRVVPYLEMRLTAEAVQGIGEIVLGYSSPMPASDHALRVLTRAAGIVPVITRSGVPVR